MLIFILFSRPFRRTTQGNDAMLTLNVHDGDAGTSHPISFPMLVPIAYICSRTADVPQQRNPQIREKQNRKNILVKRRATSERTHVSHSSILAASRSPIFSAFLSSCIHLLFSLCVCVSVCVSPVSLSVSRRAEQSYVLAVVQGGEQPHRVLLSGL